MSKEAIDLDQILKQLGPFGKYNVVNYALLLFPIYLAGMYGSVFVFEATDINYRCKITECEGLNDTSWLTNAIPIEKDRLSKCKRYAAIVDSNDTCSTAAFNKTIAYDCDTIQYSDEDSAVRDLSTTLIERTGSSVRRNPIYSYCGRQPACQAWRLWQLPPKMIQVIFVGGLCPAVDGIRLKCMDALATTFDLGCENWKRTLIGTIHNSGLFVSLPLTGIMSDRFGRKKALAVASLMNGIFGFARSFSVNYSMMLVFEFLEAALGAGAYSTAFVLAMELVGPKGRVFGNTLINFIYTFGLMSLSGLSWWLQDWRQLLRIIYAPAVLVLSYIWLLNESVRWLLSKGRNQEAAEILRKAAKMNNVDISEELNPIMEMKVPEAQEIKKVDVEDDGTSTFVKVLKSRIIRTRVIVCSFLWITCTFVYYGLSINSVGLGGNKYVNFMLVGFVEIPANFACLLVLDRFGRKKILIIMYILSASLCIGLSFLPKDQKILSLILYLSGKFSITVAYSSVYIYVSEVFPTSVRQSLLAICSSLGRVGSTLAPLTPLLALYYHNLPSIFFGSLALTASVMVLILPETLNVPLPDTIEEAERLARPKNNSVE